ncbi:MAG: hypothetical protein JWP83_421 [Mycobacterium sp.]|uniref:hypothetical protein n=1 Tax=Mycobacterium sp. TaxID=1785 RepID=UPI00263357F3|nr:hypothetical protein [Mycobacterium sp.]MCW2659269.1 hypothetical protein [Mycobacterium sp.]
MPADLDTYECLGDLETSFRVTAKDERRQRDRQRLRDSMRCEVAQLSYEQYRAGAPCPGCRRPYVDAEPFENKGTMHFSDAERARYDDEETRFKAAHGSCGSHRHSVSGSLTMHCGKCCPMPPLSPAQIARLGPLLRPTPSHELMVWQLRLYCGHTVERTAHSSHKTIHAAFCGAVRCAQCGLDPATIIDARAIGPAGKPPHQAPTPARRKPTRAELKTRIQQLEAENERLRSGHH